MYNESSVVAGDTEILEKPSQIVLGKRHSWFWLPFSDLGANIIDLPVLMLRHERSPATIDEDFLLYARDMVVTDSQRKQALHRAVIVAGLLYDYAATVVHSEITSLGDFESLLTRFLGHRFLGTCAEDGDHTGLDWHPVQWSTVCDDRRRLKLYLDFCVKKRGHLPNFRAGAIPVNVTKLPGKITQVLGFRKDMFLAHLRNSYADQPTPARFVLPSAGSPPNGKRQGGTSKGGALPIEEALRLIALTKNPVQQAIFILMHFGGPRISEIANLWVDDVLPVSYTPALFQGARPGFGPLVVLAHPTESTWTGEVGNWTTTRLAYLTARNLVPRPLLRETDPARAGWKGMCFDNDSAKISLIYWADPQLALRFGDLYEEILDKRSRLPAARTHPYLFVCLDSRQRELGNPVKVAGIRKAYYAACTRAGIEPHRNHATGHRARGGYTQLMREAGMDAEQRSKLLHQSRTSSERPYSADVYALHNVLAEHFKRRERGMRE